MIIYLKIENNKIISWSFEGDTSIITTATASVFWESIIWMDIYEILKFDYYYIRDLIGDDISPRRHKAAVLGLLSTRNAIHKYLDDKKKDDFLDLIP